MPTWLLWLCVGSVLVTSAAVVGPVIHVGVEWYRARREERRKTVMEPTTVLVTSQLRDVAGDPLAWAIPPAIHPSRSEVQEDR